MSARRPRVRGSCTRFGRQPTTDNRQPTTNNQQPTTNNQQPTTNNISSARRPVIQPFEPAPVSRWVEQHTPWLRPKHAAAKAPKGGVWPVPEPVGDKPRALAAAVQAVRLSTT